MNLLASAIGCKDVGSDLASENCSWHLHSKAVGCERVAVWIRCSQSKVRPAFKLDSCAAVPGPTASFIGASSEDILWRRRSK
ncbi:unnamed protein product, partial [Gadus morhua 'NCC']